ncbi:hypothetical protein [Hymenobacter cellulosilyticus]|uniref:Fibronectin type III domain-containing protein n=1 Tax=Hymenobacter cellulosilyticus TaxID=2932248 RepID=A0A8T9Q5U9_9BACT|nr:hypothetical protein [Hymenobacter cellulosilyticus]UOQ72342.1 hypothetical protein MUN79_28010 [Hymenobacter cellulosilyticus]
MLRTATLFTVIGLLIGTLAYGATITLFQANFDGTNVRVEWEITNEAGVQGYDLWRKANNEPAFAHLATQAPGSQRRYQFLDTNMYRGTAGTTGGGPFTYRLTVHTTTGDQNYTTVLSTTPSAVQRSWGSIKSMFR